MTIIRVVVLQISINPQKYMYTPPPPKKKDVFQIFEKPRGRLSVIRSPFAEIWICQFYYMSIIFDIAMATSNFKYQANFSDSVFFPVF